MTSDHLDRETSISAELTETGMKAGAKSRFIASIDRLGGALLDNINARIEGSTDRTRAKTKGDVMLIETIVDYGVQQLGASPEVAERAFRAHFKKVLIAQENKDRVLIEARNSLQDSPPSEDVEGDISDDFLGRFEQHAEAASSEGLRQLFGRILAGEVRQPGTVSAATLHFAAMLDTETAVLIQKFAPCVHRSMALIGLIDNTSEAEISRLTISGFWAQDKTWTLKIPSEASFARYHFQNEMKSVLVRTPNEIKVKFPCAIMSQAGKEILTCLGYEFSMHEHFAQFLLSNAGLQEAYVFDLERAGNELIYTQFRKVLPK